MVDMKSRVVFIAGGGSGIGKNLVDEFVSRGWFVICSTSSRKRVQKSKDIYSGTNPIVCINNFDQIKLDEKIKSIILKQGGVDLFISAIGGVFEFNPIIADITDESYTKAMELNFHRPRRALTAVSPYLKNDRSKIIFLSSLAAIRPPKINFDYAVSKSALRYYCKAIAYDYAERGIGVLTMALNTFISEGLKREMEFMNALELKTKQKILDKRPLKVLDDSATLAKKIASLLELDLTGITGTTISFDYGSLEAV
jgi:NAD(P)-dependent dehydrogenase (short-subunit alcohol dehydrogenase family)